MVAVAEAIAASGTVLDASGTAPDRTAALEQRVARLEALVAELMIERETAAAVVEDGAPRLGRWLRMKLAMRETGYSESGLRKLIKQGRVVADFEGPHIVIDTSTVPRKCRK
jgi:hypothetical protein